MNNVLEINEGKINSVLRNEIKGCNEPMKSFSGLVGSVQLSNHLIECFGNVG